MAIILHLGWAHEQSVLLLRGGSTHELCEWLTRVEGVGTDHASSFLRAFLKFLVRIFSGGYLYNSQFSDCELKRPLHLL